VNLLLLKRPISRLLQLYFEGASVGAEQKVKLFKLAWDLIGSPLDSRHELYERFYTGDPVRSLPINISTMTRRF
jgi:4-hydroxyphenylacetate 3-monooxygenase